MFLQILKNRNSVQKKLIIKNMWKVWKFEKKITKPIRKFFTKFEIFHKIWNFSENFKFSTRFEKFQKIQNFYKIRNFSQDLEFFRKFFFFQKICNFYKIWNFSQDLEFFRKFFFFQKIWNFYKIRNFNKIWNF